MDGHQFTWIYIMKMTVLRINKFVDNDPINTTSDKQLHFNEHIILCFNLTKKSSKKKGKKRSTDID